MDEKTRERYAQAIVFVAEARECGEFYNSVGLEDEIVKNGDLFDYFYHLRDATRSAKQFSGDSFLDEERQKLEDQARKVAKRIIK